MVSVGLAGFFWMAKGVGTGSLGEWDQRWLLAARDTDDLRRAWGGPVVLVLSKIVTQLGSAQIVVGVSVVALCIWIRRGGRRLAFYFAWAVAGGYAIILTLKAVFSRPRPAVVPHLVEVSSASFPSQHSFAAMMIFLLFAGVLTEGRGVGFRLFAILVALLIGGAVAVTRVYLGVHYPSDVVAGVCAGGAWAAICSAVIARVCTEAPSASLR